MQFNENSRVKIPTLLHCMRLGYEYISIKDETIFWDKSCNIFPDLFFNSCQKINKSISRDRAKIILDELKLKLENKDIGKSFFETITKNDGIKFIDFENFGNNSFNVVTELPFINDDEEFRPDITILINGLPLAFIEVKKPNNREGILAERKRMESRLKNKKFRNFFNLIQLMIFSNNMEYDDESLEPIEGAFYATPSNKKSKLNYFREELSIDKFKYLKIDPQSELNVLRDNNPLSIKDTPEFIENKRLDSPTNKICTSLLSKERISFFLKYGLAYVNNTKGLEKHVMRYPQFFATQAIKKEIDRGIKRGIIWHTQGSGKTALSYFNVEFLKDFFQEKGIIVKFYFIVDRLDLLKQASLEFSARSLVVHTINDKKSFIKDFNENSSITNSSGKNEITVVNIQKFQNESDVILKNNYELDIQRVFFLDEVHRSYNPKGSFLANLEQADRSAIKIGLTGTPFLGIGKDFNSRTLFGDYIHKYFYNLSVKDGYTLRLIREEIETSYKMQLKKTLEEIKILEGEVDKNFIYSHRKFVKPMLEYIVNDFYRTRLAHDNYQIGGMVVCDSSKQARKMFEIFQEMQKDKSNFISTKHLSASLILHDEGTKEERDDSIKDFKNGKIDLLFVYNMLLTGFDSERLKKLYLGRIVKAHNLLQTLTRVNRPFENFKYGYVVDFANIEKEFEKTNKNYFNELQEEFGDEIKTISKLFKTSVEIEKEIEEIKEILFNYDVDNAEYFSKQISQINERSEIIKLVKALENARSLYNNIRLSGNYKMLESLDYEKMNFLLKESRNRLSIINLKLALDSGIQSQNLLNIALEDIIFDFVKIKEEEMLLSDEYRNILQKTRESLNQNFDKNDPKFISLKEELERLFKKKNLNEITKQEMQENIMSLNLIFNKAKEISRKNRLLKEKYKNDEKYTRLHKRLMEKELLTNKEIALFNVLNELKKEVDNQIEKNTNILNNEKFVEKMLTRISIDKIKKQKIIPFDLDLIKNMNKLLVREYMNEFQGI